MKKIMILCFLNFLASNTFSQYWMRSFGGITIDEGIDITQGFNKETFSTGYFSNTALFGNTVHYSSGLTDIYFVKTDSVGLISWVNQAGGNGIDKGLAVDADNSGNCVITGFFSDTAQFGAITLISAGQQDVFIAKYNAAGNLIWAINAGGANADVGNCVKFDNAGNIIVTGEFSGSCNFGGTTLTSLSGSIDVFTAKYNANGSLLWVKQGSGLYTDRGIKLAVDNSGNIYVNGLFSDTITFDLTHYTSIGNAKFLIKYDQGGNEKWFRWMGGSSQSEVGGMEEKNNTLTLTGSFLGNLYFFGGGPTQVLNGTGNYNIYLCRYDTAGNLLWKTTTGSFNDFYSKDVTVSVNDDIIITGNFNCRLTAFSDVYGEGTFCSAGFSDCFVAGYDNTGNWLWARNFGSRKNDFAHSVSIGSASQIIITGAAGCILYSTVKPSDFLGYNTGSAGGSGSFCNDSDYFKVVKLFSDTNSSDIFINNNINLLREPLDFFDRSGAGCLRPFGKIAICSNAFGLCTDTLAACGSIQLSVDLMAIDSVPDFNYLWSNGQTTKTATINSTGITVVSVISKDGCFTITDTVYVIINPNPPVPLISDNKGINYFNLNTLPVYLCMPDSVVLFTPSSGVYTVEWSNFLAGQNPVTTNSPGLYTCMLTDSLGCYSTNFVQVIGATPIAPILPVMICLEDQDKNDTLTICDSGYINIFIYDSIDNPTGSFDCILYLSHISWSYTINGFPYTYQAGCNPYGILSILSTPPGIYDYVFSAWVVQINACDTDSVFMFNKMLHVIVTPSPPGGLLTTNISGPVEMCPGDTALLIATGGTTFLWNNGSTNDSLYTTVPGYYFVNTDSVASNSFGCLAHYYGYANFILNTVQQPVITTNPPGAIFCINDSIQLICSGNTGSFQWQGPTGVLTDTLNTVYVGIPGYYYCIQTVSPTCQVISTTIQVSQITTPSIGVFPSTILCKGDSVEIIVYADPGTPIFWYPPLFGVDLHQSVYDSGTYSCEVFSCNNIYTFSITVNLDSGLAIISALDSSLTFCAGDSILLSGNPGMMSYSWTPSGALSQNIFSGIMGTVSLSTINVNGCKDSTTVFLIEQPNNLNAPFASDTILCIGDSMVIVAQGANSINWTYQPLFNTVFYQGYAYQTPPLFTPVTYYLFADSGKCKSDFDSIKISIAPPAIALITASDSLLKFCEGEFITLSANTGLYSYLWLPGNENTLSIQVDTTNTISLITTTPYGCKDSTGVNLVEQTNNLQPPFATDTIVCEGESIQITAFGSQHINWSSALNYTQVIQTGGYFQTPLLFLPVTYYLFSDSGLCKSAFDSVSVLIDPCQEIPDTIEPFVPNIFTPNGDGFNEYFPGFDQHNIKHLLVYNRWGEELFEAENIYNGWDGVAKNNIKVPDGQYFYLLTYYLKNNQQIFKKGYFMLIR